MSSMHLRNDTPVAIHSPSTIDMKLEVIVIPVADVDRSKRFYDGLGWRLDADFVMGEDFRIVQFTPPRSPCSIHFGTGVTAAAPGSSQGLYLVVSDIEAARADLLARGVEVSELFHGSPADLSRRARTGIAPLGPDPERRSYGSYASFSDPDGNGWLLQEVTVRLPGRLDSGTASFSSTAVLASALRRAASAHGEHEKRMGRRDEDWAAWYSDYLLREQNGQPLPQ
jgi:catechol 2,3-dioxygenase-like lactoylglutathione lyase family enzyme